MGEEVLFRFWCEYIGADELRRYELVESLYEVVFKGIVRKEFKDTFVGLLKSYFDDLLYVCSAGCEG